MTVTLSPDEERIAQWVAHQRQARNDLARVVDTRASTTTSSEGIHLQGFRAELAFCKLFNVYPDFDTTPRRGSSDCARWGESIDVKSTTHTHGKLICFARKRELASDVYALLVDDGPAFRFVGFTRATELFTDAHLTDLGRGPTYTMTQAELTPTQGRP